jgi:hypothetical protein
MTSGGPVRGGHLRGSEAHDSRSGEDACVPQENPVAPIMITAWPEARFCGYWNQWELEHSAVI